jgi:hypothetical protein
MTNNIVQFRLDSIVGNINNLEVALKRIYELLKLKPFVRFELLISKSIVIPVVLINCGKYTIELLEFSDIEILSGISCIDKVIFESPYDDFGSFELSTNLKIEIRKNSEIKKPKIIELKLKSINIEIDRDFLINQCGFNSNNHEDILEFSGIRFVLKNTQHRLLENQIVKSLRDTAHNVAGWHRISLACIDVEVATNHLLEGGAKLLEAPYKVLPGLRESMVVLPSGLVMQPMIQQLWKMIPIMLMRGLIAKFTSHYMRFYVTEVKLK